MKILIIRFSSIGDIVLTTPVVRALKQQLPEAELHYATKADFLPLLQFNPYITKVWGYRSGSGLVTFIRQLRRENIDCVVDLHNNLRTSFIKLGLRRRTLTVNKRNIRKWIMVRYKIYRWPVEHVVVRYLRTVQALGVRDDHQGLDFFISPNEQVSLPFSHQLPYVVYAIGGNHYTKKLPLRRMIDLCRRIPFPLVLIGGSQDFAVGEEISREINSAPAREKTSFDSSSKVYNACGKYTLLQSGLIIKQAIRVVSHDTGMMHVAAAFGKHIYCLWGNTFPKFGMYPYRTPHTSLERHHLSCRPCSKIGFSTCPQKHFKCMEELDFQPLLVDLRSINYSTR